MTATPAATDIHDVHDFPGMDAAEQYPPHLWKTALQRFVRLICRSVRPVLVSRMRVSDRCDRGSYPSPWRDRDVV